MYEDFIIRAKIKRNEYLLKTEEHFVTNKDKWFTEFTWNFQDVCTQIRKLQENSSIPVISHLDYLMLYTNFINRCYVADIFLFGDNS